jgi:hypothetical protein
MTDAIAFGDQAEVEMRRRGVSQAKAVCAVTDGADWIQGFIDLHRPDAVRILDFPHGASHLGLLIEALHQAGVALPADALERSLHILKHAVLVSSCAGVTVCLLRSQGLRLCRSNYTIFASARR